MARIKQWMSHTSGDEQFLSYLLYDPISRRSALIDPQPQLVSEYLQTLSMRGMSNRYVLYTSAVEPDESLFELPGIVIAQSPQQKLGSTESLALGELRILLIRLDEQGAQQAFVCDGMMFTGSGWLPAGANQQPPQALMNFPDDYIIYPGQVSSGLRISCVGQERALSALASQSTL